MKKFKQWFFAQDDQGVSWFDVLCASVLNLGAWALIIMLMRRFGR